LEGNIWVYKHANMKMPESSVERVTVIVLDMTS
jgi:hypothetical protein